MLISQFLCPWIYMGIYKNYNEAVIGGERLEAVTLKKGTTIPIYIAPIDFDEYLIQLLIFLTKISFLKNFFFVMFKEICCSRTVFVGYH